MKYRIKDIRQAKGITQEKLASKSGVSRATIWKLENGDDEVTTTKTLFSIANALDVDMDDLFFAQNAQ